jgi:hypothetical protein
MGMKRTEMRYYDRNFAWLAHTVQKPEFCVPRLISNFISTSNSCGYQYGIWDLGLNSMNHYSPANFNLRQSEEKSLQNSRVNSSIIACWSFKLKPYSICARHSKNWGKKPYLISETNVESLRFILRVKYGAAYSNSTCNVMYLSTYPKNSFVLVP